MGITTVTSQPPMIAQKFNRKLLVGILQEMLDRVEEIKNRSKTKIPSHQTGRRKEFEKYEQNFRQAYEQFEDKKADFKAKKKELEERSGKANAPGVPAHAGSTVQFRRYSE